VFPLNDNEINLGGLVRFGALLFPITQGFRTQLKLPNVGHKPNLTRSRNPFRAKFDPDVRDLYDCVKGTIQPHGGW
jgi:hypothetical protein